eukprot:CAMPEP_0204840720 /NCGR_PEP_ID=MMETSP1346-20131115/38778_1 /ASSEMBLY_ACC=CAM_ASM_000771 /TAXON_ID=215587 /ORGANISM="Aplanochytrium stocchinoi, Strain GSBS06" /LENGTH=60 /DNA_ID=CAMNT_0051978311 /DNA_START=40 /DNA_END=218 /DNA_ORIENTATION=-
MSSTRAESIVVVQESKEDPNATPKSELKKTPHQHWLVTDDKVGCFAVFGGQGYEYLNELG